MTSRWTWTLAALIAWGAGPGRATAQPPLLQRRTDPPPEPARPPSLEALVFHAIKTDPALAPYPVRVEEEGGKLVLSGVVGTKQLHDLAVRTAIAFTPSIDDRLVIDTAATLLAVPGGVTGAPAGPSPRGPTWGATAYANPGMPYVYPPPLFGYLDEPFYGLEPPVISYPPYWGALSAHRLAETAAAFAPRGRPAPPVDAAGLAGAVAQANRTSPLPANTVEMSLDPRGVAVLRGTVSTLEERIGLGRKIADTPGVTEVINLIDVRPDQSEADPEPPAAPGPAFPAPQPEGVPPPPPVRPDAASRPESTEGRVERAIGLIPALKGQSVRVAARDGVVTLEGKVPTAYEAMLAFRVAQTADGVTDVVDRLQFELPRPGGPNPLLDRGDPADVELYLEAQLRRQLGGSARVDRVRLRGDQLEVVGSIPEAADRERVEAVLRSMPLLRGFQILPQLRIRG